MAELAIIVPVYNEGENFRRVFFAIQDKVRTPNRIYVIYDFDEDSTLPYINQLLLDFPDRLCAVKNIFGRGVVKALKTGFQTAREPVLLVTMGDLSDDLSDVDKMYQKMVQGNFDIVCGTRYSKGGKLKGQLSLKSIFSRMAGISLRWLSGIPTNDITNNFKMYRATVLKQINLESSGGFEIAMEITAKAFLNGYKIAEIPTIWQDRTSGQSNFKLWAWLPRYLHWYVYVLFGRLKHLWRGK